MKTRILLLIGFLLIALIGTAQVSNVADFRIANATTAFGVNLPVGTKVYNIATEEYFAATEGVVLTATLTTAAASFTLINDHTALSTGTITATTYGITSDGGTDDVVLAAATTSLAGLQSAADKSKLNAIAAGAQVNLSSKIDTFEEASGTPTAHTLSNTIVVTNCEYVSCNGSILNPSQYTLTTTTLTLDIAYQFDQVQISYKY